MSEYQAQQIADAVVEWMREHGKIPYHVYGEMTANDRDALAEVIMKEDE